MEREKASNLIRDGVDEDEPIPQEDGNEEDFMDPSRIRSEMGADDGQSKVVQEARKLMQEAEDEPNQQIKAEPEESGPGIRMGRLGKKKKRGQATAAPAEEKTAYTQKLGGISKAVDDFESRISGEGFKEEDIEFMRKAIQVLCQSTNPLGKSIDFVTDDVESMSNEYKLWRQEAISCNQKLEEA